MVGSRAPRGLSARAPAGLTGARLSSGALLPPSDGRARAHTRVVRRPGRPRRPAAADQGRDPRPPGRSHRGRRPGARHLQHRRLLGRAAGVPDRQGAREPRRGGQVAGHPLVGGRHRRPGDRHLGLAHRALESGPGAALARRPAAHPPDPGLRDVAGEPRPLRRRDPPGAPAHALRLPVVAVAHRPPRPRARGAARRPGGAGRLRDLRAALRPSARRDRGHLRLSGRQWLRRAGCRLHRPPVSAGLAAHHRRGHPGGDRRSGGPAPARWGRAARS